MVEASMCSLDPIRVAQDTVTAANVIAEMGSVLEAATDEMLTAGVNLQFKVSPNVGTAYRIATASTNTINNVTVGLGLTFLDIPIVVDYGLPANTILLSDPNNFVYALDAEGDIDSLQIVDFSKTTLDRTIGARADFKIGFYITNSEQVIFYGSCVAS
jgi:hypothetical protein